MQVTTSKYDNFVNSINSEQTREQYEYSLSQFLKHYQMDLDSFLRLSQQEISDYIVNYLVNKRVSKQYKIVIFSAIKHACVMNDIILNWSKMKKFIRTENRDNSVNGKDRGYTHEEIQTILEHSDLRTRVAFLLLSSCGRRVGALPTMKVRDLEERGFTISHDLYYRLRKEVKESTHSRLSLIASEEFSAQHLSRLDTLKTIENELWSNYHAEQNPTKKSNILMQIAEMQELLAAFYDSTRWVMQQATRQKKQRQQEQLEK